MTDEKFVDKICPFCFGEGKVKQISGNWLREARLAKNISLSALAREIGISGAYLSDIERGRRNAPKKLLEYFKVEKNYLDLTNR